jgi:hypothetical protein
VQQIEHFGRIDYMRKLYALFVGSSLAVAPLVALASPAAPHSTSAYAPVNTSTGTAVTPRAATPQLASRTTSDDDAARYAARDATSSAAKQYRGGDTVVIGASAAVAILAVVLLIVLL